ncbi:hypothetical protein C8Q76DRAFT_628981 [Earliella scabrosa]|nr:hypothetical protein C8Q76DRAFT_628981 [Earliella scabrosa]
MSWIHTTFVDYDVQNSLVDVVPELEPDHAMTLVITILTREVPLTPAVLVKSIRDRTSGLMLLDVGARLEKEPLSRIIRMLLKLLKHLPRDHDPTKLGALNVIWTLWHLGLGATKGAGKDRCLFQAILDNLAELLHEGEPFRLRRAAISLLYDSSCVVVWPYRHCPPAIGHVISFARSCYQHRIPDLFMKASAVVLCLCTELAWKDDEAMPHHRQQLSLLLRDLTRFLRQCNEIGTRYEERSASRIVRGIAALAGTDAELVPAALARVLLEGGELGLLELSRQEHTSLAEMLMHRDSSVDGRAPLPNGAAIG